LAEVPAAERATSFLGQRKSPRKPVPSTIKSGLGPSTAGSAIRKKRSFNDGVLGSFKKRSGGGVQLVSPSKNKRKEKTYTEYEELSGQADVDRAKRKEREKKKAQRKEAAAKNPRLVLPERRGGKRTDAGRPTDASKCAELTNLAKALEEVRRPTVQVPLRAESPTPVSTLVGTAFLEPNQTVPSAEDEDGEGAEGEGEGEAVDNFDGRGSPISQSSVDVEEIGANERAAESAGPAEVDNETESGAINPVLEPPHVERPVDLRRPEDILATLVGRNFGEVAGGDFEDANNVEDDGTDEDRAISEASKDAAS
jgi:hypothetical protein